VTFRWVPFRMGARVQVLVCVEQAWLRHGR